LHRDAGRELECEGGTADLTREDEQVDKYLRDQRPDLDGDAEPLDRKSVV